MYGSNYLRWLLQVVVITNHVTSVIPMLMSKFELVTSPSGKAWCSVDPPQVVLQMACGDMERTCAMECLKDGCCLLYQFKSNSFLCELFEYTTTTFSVIPGCSSQRITMRDGQSAVTQRNQTAGYLINGSNGKCIFTHRPIFFVVNPSIGKVFDCRTCNPGDYVVTMTKNAAKTSQQWYFDAHGYLRSVLNDYAVDLDSSSPKALLVKPFNGNINQQWYFRTNVFLNKNFVNLCPQIWQGQNADGVNIRLWANDGSSWNNMWSLTPT